MISVVKLEYPWLFWVEVNFKQNLRIFKFMILQILKGLGSVPLNVITPYSERAVTITTRDETEGVDTNEFSKVQS